MLTRCRKHHKLNQIHPLCIEAENTCLSFGERPWSLNPVLTPLNPPCSLLSVYFANTPKAHTSREGPQLLWSLTSWLTFSLFFFFFFPRSGNGLAVFRRIELWVFPHNCAKHSHMQLCISPSLIFSMWEWHEVNMFRGYLCVSSTLRCPLAFWAPPSPTCSMVRVFMRA